MARSLQWAEKNPDFVVYDLNTPEKDAIDYNSTVWQLYKSSPAYKAEQEKAGRHLMNFGHTLGAVMDVAGLGKLMHAPPMRLRKPVLGNKTAKNTEPHKATKRRGKETKLQQNAKPKQYPKGEDIPIEKANAELQTRNPRHIDIGGEGKYPNALNFTIGDAPNRVDGFAQKTLKNIDDKSVDLITIENAPTIDPILLEVSRVLKQGGELRIKTYKDFFESNKEKFVSIVPEKFGFSLKSNKIFKEMMKTETTQTMVELKFIKK